MVSKTDLGSALRVDSLLQILSKQDGAMNIQVQNGEVQNKQTKERKKQRGRTNWGTTSKVTWHLGRPHPQDPSHHLKTSKQANF